MDLQPTTIPSQEEEHDADERSLIDRARTDPASFGVLYRRYYRAVAGCIYRRVGNVHVTEDLAADVFIRAFKGIHRYRHGNAPFRFWLYRIATNVVTRWARTRRTGFFGLERNHPGFTEGPAVHDDLLTALRSLGASHQAVVSLHYFEELSVQEVAIVLGCSVGTVKSRLSRARDRLRHKLEQGQST